MAGVCMAGGVHGGEGVCMEGGVHGRGHAWQGGMHGGGMRGRGACMVGACMTHPPPPWQIL